jgi:SAM-dependent methyltransferase
VTAGGFPGKAFFAAVYAGEAPWDIGSPQPDLLRLIDEHPPGGTILDLGCGTGDLAIGLAERGHRVVGVDFAEEALAVARARLERLSPERRALVDLEAADALHPSAWSGWIGAAVDSGFYHLFEASVRDALVRDLARALPVGGRYYMLGFGVSLPAPDVPRVVTPEEIRERFSAGAGWRVLALREAAFRTNGFGDVPALALCAERSEVSA